VIDPIEEIARARQAHLMARNGHASTLVLAPRLSAAEIEQLEARFGFALPRELRRLLEHTAGVEGAPLASIDFTGAGLTFEQKDLFPAGLPVAHDGSGNYWVLDLTPETADIAPVFFVSRDASVVLYQSPSLGYFLHETFRMSMQPSLVEDVQKDRLYEVSRTHPRTLGRADALGGDEQLRDFALTLDDRFVFVDLRSPKIGMGFSWRRFGPQTEVRRHGYHRLFAYAPPRKASALRRLLT
jgi:cell wall assembly regulator SMI1